MIVSIRINAAIRNNTQLFITTHDTDSIKGFRDAAFGKFDDIVESSTIDLSKQTWLLLNDWKLLMRN